MNLSLHEITDELTALRNALLESGGEITEEMNERFDELLDAEEDKTEGYIAVIRSMEEQAEAFKREEKRLKKRRKAAANTAESLKERLLASMEVRGQDERETSLGKVKRQRNSSSGTTVFADSEDLPPALRRVKISADKRAIKEEMERIGSGHLRDLETNEIIAQIDEPGYHLRIY
jgi:hypothetical protein